MTAIAYNEISAALHDCHLSSLNPLVSFRSRIFQSRKINHTIEPWMFIPLEFYCGNCAP